MSKKMTMKKVTLEKYIPGLPEVKPRKPEEKPLSEEEVWKRIVLPKLEAWYNPSMVDHRFQRVPVKWGRETKWADSIVYRLRFGKKEPYIVVETKAEGEPADVLQAESYARFFRAPFFLITNGKYWLWFETGERPKESKQLPEGIMPKVFPVLKTKVEPFESLYEFKQVLRLCHNSIRNIEGYDPAASFDEMSKIVFIKMFDERRVDIEKKQNEYLFAIYPNETPEEVVARIRDLYEKSQENYQEIFKEAEREYPTLLRINLKDRTVFEVIKKLQKYSLLKTEVEIKGSTYETFLKGSFRGVLGQFFTPREVVEFMVHFVEPKRTHLILDPACGSGGFLVETMKAVWKQIDELYKKGVLENPVEEKQKFATQNLFGLDLNARMSWVSKMNMVMHGNGHGRIHHHDALVDSEKVRDRGIKPESFNVILTNPPFGSKVPDQKILVNYELGMGRKRQLTEVLFLERCLELLKPKGMLGMVVPDGLLSNVSLQYVRNFLDEQAIWKAVISLPLETFMPYGSGVKASLVFLQKKDAEGQLRQGEVFMANAQNIGYDATGRATGRKDLPYILKAYKSHGVK